MLALEPEPCCFLETVEETIAFFRDHLHTDASAAIVADQTGTSPAAAHDALRRHLGVCYDVCHGAVEFEEPARAFAQLGGAGIRIGKLQLSSALRVPEIDANTEKTLTAFNDGVYLHQVVQRRNGSLVRYVDLEPAFAALRAGEAGGEWRVHCHVPVFLEIAGGFHSTQPTLKAALAAAKAVGADYAGVDLLPARDGTVYVVEINGIPGWRGLQEATSSDVAGAIVEHLLERVAPR